MKKSGLFHMMWNAYEGIRIALLSSFFLIIIGDFYILYQLYMTQKALRQLQLKNSQVYVRSILLLFAGLLLIQLLNYIGKYLQEQLRNRAQKKFRAQLIAHATRLKLREVEKYTTQDLLRLLTDDTDSIVSLLLTIAYPTQVVIQFLSMVIFLIRMNTNITWVLLGVGMGVLLVTKLFNRIQNIAFSALRQVYVNSSDVLYDAVQGHTVIRIFRLQKRFIELAQKLYYKSERVRIKTFSILSIQHQLIDGFFMSVLAVGIFGILLTQGAYGRRAMAGDYYVMIGYLGTLAFYFKSMPNISQGIAEARVAHKHIQTFLEAPLDDEEVEIETPVDSAYDLQLCDLGFTYDGSHYLFENLSVSIPQGSFATIKGESGSGKSTLLKVLAGFYTPSKGEVRLGGIPLQDIPFAHIRHIISYIAQENLIIRGTIRDNIVLGRNDIPDDVIWQALQRVGLDKMIKARGQGLDLLIEESGKNLSGGERQRISIVRALVRQSQVVLIDEGTSALDGENKKLLLDTIANLKALHKTVIFVTHDEDIWKQGDIKLVLGEG